mmetsp:Transcript_38831/g.91350  ORF Transcript_38831/g.91350 Transcript_38831/m.91350 type:complete len:219 (-) Transcript_38831:1196-1852(-)
MRCPDVSMQRIIWVRHALELTLEKVPLRLLQPLGCTLQRCKGWKRLDRAMYNLLQATAAQYALSLGDDTIDFTFRLGRLANGACANSSTSKAGHRQLLFQGCLLLFPLLSGFLEQLGVFCIEPRLQVDEQLPRLLLTQPLYLLRLHGFRLGSIALSGCHLTREIPDLAMELLPLGIELVPLDGNHLELLVQHLRLVLLSLVLALRVLQLLPDQFQHIL